MGKTTIKISVAKITDGNLEKKKIRVAEEQEKIILFLNSGEKAYIIFPKGTVEVIDREDTYILIAVNSEKDLVVFASSVSIRILISVYSGNDLGIISKKEEEVLKKVYGSKIENKILDTIEQESKNVMKQEIKAETKKIVREEIQEVLQEKQQNFIKEETQQIVSKKGSLFNFLKRKS